MAVGPQESVLYPVGSRVLAAVVVAFCLFIEVSLLAYGHLEVTLRATPAVLLVAAGAIVLFWVPRVELSPSELRVVNPLRTHHVTWPAIRDIETRWSLTIDTVRGRLTAWAAPSPGLFSQVGRMRRNAFSVSLNNQREPRGAELARHLVMRQWEAYREQGVLGAVEGDGVTTRWNVPAVVTLAVLLAAAVAGAVWP
jgi:hypothetical protein